MRQLLNEESPFGEMNQRSAAVLISHSAQRWGVPHWLITMLVLSVQMLPAQNAAPPTPNAARPYSVRWIPESSNAKMVIVEVSGISPATLQQLRGANRGQADWQRLLAIHVEQGEIISDINLPPMLGSYAVHEDTIRFSPLFPLKAGLKYRAVFRPDQLPGATESGRGTIAASFQIPRPAQRPTTFVAKVYPSAATVPENLLKFYLIFSAPMSRGHSYDHIRLQDENGKEVELPFLEIEEELWDTTMTRLTLFIDPGRIKRGVKPLEEIGPALEEGKQFTLIIDEKWEDAKGNPLKETFRKNFKVGPPDRDPPDPARWKIQPPKAATREPLTISFPDPIDHALAQRLIRVRAASDESVEGKISMDDQERRWALVPELPWQRGTYTLLIQTTIEDLAGNNIGKPFEVDVFEKVQRQLTNAISKLGFEVR
jgi:hypothetical protein